jgi:prevent-host-death family protein
MTAWNLADAKNRFSELVNMALTKGPQRVHRRHDEVIVISAKEYDKLKGKQTSFKDYIVQGESFDSLDLTRDASDSRDIGL